MTEATRKAQSMSKESNVRQPDHDREHVHERQVLLPTDPSKHQSSSSHLKGSSPQSSFVEQATQI
eukprot:c21026_g3_i1 orf=1-192(-)